MLSQARATIRYCSDTEMLRRARREVATQILAGKIRGRVVVNLGRQQTET